MSMLNAPGWIHEHDQSGEPSGTPEGALMAWLRYGRGGCDDNTDDREIDALDDATHVVSLMELRTLKSEEEREAEMVELDDEELMADLPIGGQYYHQTKCRVYVTKIQYSGDENSGVLTISYARRGKK